jgi:hypothetical protein
MNMLISKNELEAITRYMDERFSNGWNLRTENEDLYEIPIFRYGDYNDALTTRTPTLVIAGEKERNLYIVAPDGARKIGVMELLLQNHVASMGTRPAPSASLNLN